MSQFNAWSFLRDVLRRGEAIAESHRHSGVEDFNAKLDAVASKLADELKPHLAARPADDAEPVTHGGRSHPKTVLEREREACEAPFCTPAGLHAQVTA